MSLRDPIAGLVAFALSLAFFVMTWNYSGGSEMYPRLVSGLMMITSALLILRAVIRPTEGERLSPEARRRVGIAVALTIGYIASIVPLGFILSSLIYIPLSSICLGMRSYLTVGITTILYVAFVYYLFHEVFYTPLPQGLIFSFF